MSVNSYSLSTLTVDSEVIWKLAGITYSMLKHLPFSAAETKTGKRVQRMNQDSPQPALVPAVCPQSEACFTFPGGPSKRPSAKKTLRHDSDPKHASNSSNDRLKTEKRRDEFCKY